MKHIKITLNIIMVKLIESREMGGVSERRKKNSRFITDRLKLL